MSKNYTNPETIGLHAGWRKDENTNSVAVPIHQSTSYQFDDCDHAANLFALSELGNIYSRIMNPTVAVLEDRIAALEGGVGALGVASGQAASGYAIQNICRKGDNFVASSHLYGGTYNQFKNPLNDMGIEVRFVDPSDPENFLKATDENTRAYYGEVLPNPSFEVFPIAEVAALGKPLGIPLIVDNTAASPFLCNPFKFGADLIVHSTTKYMSGNGTSLGGAVVDSGNFNWSETGKFKSLSQEEPGYHGLKFHDTFGPYAFIIYSIAVSLRDLGMTMAPQNAFQTLLGLETLSLRMKKHVSNSIKIANWLEKHPKIEKVTYAGLKSSQYFNTASM